MNKTFLLIILFLSIHIFSWGQQFSREEKIERLKAQKVAFITNKLNLSTEEAQAFWPVYNDFFKKREGLARQKKQITLDLQNNWMKYSSEKKTELADSLINFRLKEAKLEQAYHQKFKSILSIDKVIKLYNSEQQYKNYLLTQIRNQNSLKPSQREAKRK
ncbi:hypothetical protein [Plebeiibacterium marinum]|uniref:Sensor of ECF-type sigma factor n=1 Tax=Plebeiibacterium marinum TaxID=2992111 RepID=A0AAE3MGX6_9BACT|nr:hypothetical protein [Plebeiobacterium marinum]MCW3807286.1 hypothetical protein [Plebeiobacterium marinum]